MKNTLPMLFAALALGSTPATAQEIKRGDRPIHQVARELKSGEFVWAPNLSPDGPALLIVNLETQRAVLFRNGVPIGASTISSGKPGYDTPTGVFTILQKRQEHYSSTYDNAPMPNMQRLTWKGIALHAGKLPGYPASHGCIRLPSGFSSLLFGATEVGMTVVITRLPAEPAQSAAPAVATLAPRSDMPISSAPYEWHPERSPASNGSIVSVVVSAADGHAVVMRDGVEIGSAPVRVRGEVKPTAYVLRAWDSSGQHWLKLQLGGTGEGMDVSPSEARRFDGPAKFRYDVATVLRPGSVVIVTPESLRAGSVGREQTVIEEDGGAPPGQAR